MKGSFSGAKNSSGLIGYSVKSWSFDNSIYDHYTHEFEFTSLQVSTESVPASIEIQIWDV